MMIPHAVPAAPVGAIADDVVRWMEALRAPTGGYRYARQAYHTCCGEATAAAVGVLWELGLLPGLADAERHQLVHTLQNYQDPQGRFHDDALTPQDLLNTEHPWSKIDEHLAGACEQALAMLGHRPRVENTTHPIYDFTQGDLDAMIRSLDHRDCPWGRCHNVAFSLLWYRLRQGHTAPAKQRIDTLYRLIETEMLNPADGMPGAIDHPAGNRLAGYYMLTFAYLPFGRPMPNPQAAIDLILLATDDAGRVGDKGMCHIWDALYVLNVVAKQLRWSYRFQDTVDTTRRIADFLMREHRKPDGGFSYDPARSLTHQNHIRATPDLAQSDMQGTLMSLACLNIIACFANKTTHADFLSPWIRDVATPQKQSG